jgi:hypothetical protein
MQPLKILFLLIAALLVQPAWAQKEKCLGLTLQPIKIVDECNKFVVVDVTIENNGLRTIDLPDKRTLGLQFFWSGTASFQPGSILQDGSFIDSFGDYGAHLSPDGVCTKRIKISKSHKTSTLKFLVVLVDPTFKYEECDETDNTKSILIMN